MGEAGFRECEEVFLKMTGRQLVDQQLTGSLAQLNSPEAQMEQKLKQGSPPEWAHSPSLHILAGSSAMVPCRDALPHLRLKAMEPNKQTDRNDEPKQTLFLEHFVMLTKSGWGWKERSRAVFKGQRLILERAVCDRDVTSALPTAWQTGPVTSAEHKASESFSEWKLWQLLRID